MLDHLARRAVDPLDDVRPQVHAVPGERAQDVLDELAAAVHGPRGVALGRGAAGPDDEHRVAVQHGLVRHLREGLGQGPLQAEVGDDGWHGGHRPLDVRRQRGQPARVDRDHDDVGVERPGGRDHTHHAAVADDEVLHVDAGLHGDPPGREPLDERGRQRAHPALDGPGPEALLEVGDQPGPRGHVAEVVSLGDERVRGDRAQSLVPEPLPEPLVQHLAGVEEGGHLPRQRVRGPRHLEVAAPEHLPHVGVGVDVVDPLLPEPGPELVERLVLRGPRLARQPQHRRVLEDVLPDEGERDDLDLPLGRPAGLPEQVAHHRRHQHRGGAGVPRVATGGHRDEGTAERGQPVQDGDLVPELGEPCRRGQAAEAAAHDDDATHGAAGWGEPRFL